MAEFIINSRHGTKHIQGREANKTHGRFSHYFAERMYTSIIHNSDANFGALVTSLEMLNMLKQQ